jgi:predicted XRE-type DNA-binding protein
MINAQALLERESPEVRARVKAKADAILLELNLSEIRDYASASQKQIVEALGIKQPTISKMEKVGNDMKLSSLKRYVEATGCTLRIDVELPDGTHRGFIV